jgi:hypothetical protein
MRGRREADSTCRALLGTLSFAQTQCSLALVEQTSSRGKRMNRKFQAFDRWVCFDCRWTAKHPRRSAADDVRQPRCPKCSLSMKYSGTAFRAPAHDDVEGWGVAERLIAAGHLFRSTRRRQAFPRTFRELEDWQKQEAFWSPEGKAKVEVVDGRLHVWVGAHKLENREELQVWAEGWKTGVMRLVGDGGLPLPRPVLMLGRRVMVVERHTRIRVLQIRKSGNQ